jgi:hypothetical protein
MRHPSPLARARRNYRDGQWQARLSQTCRFAHAHAHVHARCKTIMLWATQLNETIIKNGGARNAEPITAGPAGPLAILGPDSQNEETKGLRHQDQKGPMFILVLSIDVNCCSAVYFHTNVHRQKMGLRNQIRNANIWDCGMNSHS